MELWKKACVLGIALLCGAADPVWAEPQTPPIFVNDNDVLAEAPKRGAVVLTYDVRRVGGQQIKVFIDQLPLDPKAKEPQKTLYLEKSAGKLPLDYFYDCEAGIYAVSAQACDGKGQPVADRSRVVYLRYGGDRALKNYDKRRAEWYGPAGRPKAFAEVISADQMPKVAGTLKPVTTVIKPGETARLSYKIVSEGQSDFAKLRELMKDYDTNVYWRLQGEGVLRNISPTEAVYESPEQGEHTVKVLVRFLGNVEESTIYVTNMKPGQEL
ncbi:MAG: hypothetical protein Q4F00_01710 [bacterium]|nr:hypothetical protein [bacterium]